MSQLKSAIREKRIENNRIITACLSNRATKGKARSRAIREGIDLKNGSFQGEGKKSKRGKTKTAVPLIRLDSASTNPEKKGKAPLTTRATLLRVDSIFKGGKMLVHVYQTRAISQKGVRVKIILDSR